MPGERHLIVTVHWSDHPKALDLTARVMERLKMPGTKGFAEAWEENEESHAFYAEFKRRGEPRFTRG
jgi:glycine/D-amino acid oxidase-like deaminating enzyme